MILKGSFFSNVLQMETNITIVAPNNFNSVKAYKVVYLLHGLCGNSGDWVNYTMLPVYAYNYQSIFIMPEVGRSFYSDMTYGFKYFSFVTEELPIICKNVFNILSEREDTAVIGCSMGGYGAIRNGLKYHDTFGYIGAISAALLIDDLHNWGEGDDLLSSRSFAQSCFGDLNKVIGSDMDPKFLIDDLIANDIEIPKIFMAVGDNDFLYDENIDYYNYLKSRNVDVEFRCSSGEHTWEFCNDYIKEFIEWLPL